MQNALNQDKAEQKWNKAKGTIDNAISDAKNMDTDDLRAVATELTTKVRDVSTNFYNDSIGFVKRYPVSSALGLAAAGFFLGAFSARRK
ncbi:MAG: hypothetical protein ACXWQO_16730 [Bdellovibrionota bacterium]